LFVELTVSGKAFIVPILCCCCGREPSAEVEVAATKRSGKRVVQETTRAWRFPVCGACLKHQTEWASAEAYPRYGWTAGGLVGCFGLLVFFLAALAGTIGLLVFGVAGLILSAAIIPLVYVLRSSGRDRSRAACSPECAQPSAAVRYLGWNGSLHSFAMYNRYYASEFMRANISKIGALDAEAHSLFSTLLEARASNAASQLERAREEHSRAQAEAAAELERSRAEQARGRAEAAARREQALDARARAREEAEFVKWMSKIEGARGPAARRAAVEAGSGAVSQESLRARLHLEGARSEVRAALEKADGLSKSAAKIRVLREATESIGGYAVPAADLVALAQPLEAAIADAESGVMRMNPVSK
jgi:hypothetical protein